MKNRILTALIPFVLLISCSQGEVKATITFSDGSLLEFESERVSGLLTIDKDSRIDNLQITATMDNYTIILLVADVYDQAPPFTVPTDFSEKGLAKLIINERREIEDGGSSSTIEVQEYNATTSGKITIDSDSDLKIGGNIHGSFEFVAEGINFDDTIQVDDGSFYIPNIKEDYYNAEMVDNPVEGKNPA